VTQKENTVKTEETTNGYDDKEEENANDNVSIKVHKVNIQLKQRQAHPQYI